MGGADPDRRQAPPGGAVAAGAMTVQGPGLVGIALLCALGPLPSDTEVELRGRIEGFVLFGGESLVATTLDTDLVVLRPDGTGRVVDCRIRGDVEVRGGRFRLVRTRIAGDVLVTEGADVALEFCVVDGEVVVGPLADVRLEATNAPIRRVLAAPRAGGAAPADEGRADAPDIRADLARAAAEALPYLLLDENALCLPAERLGAGPPLVRSALEAPLDGAADAVDAARRLASWDPGVSAATPLTDPLLVGQASEGPPLGGAEVEEIAAAVAPALLGATPPVRTLLEGHVLAHADRRRTARLASLVSRPRLAALVAEVERIFTACPTETSVRAVPGLVEVPPPPGSRGDFYRAVHGLPGLPDGVVIGGPGPNLHLPGDGVIVDVGGDDTYVCRPADVGEAVVVFDLGGNDLYAGSPASSRGGIVAIVDASGDDVYDGGDGSIGAAIGGAAAIRDRGGNDRYVGRRFAVGAAVAGVGLVLDEGGDDRYEISSFGQGAAGPGGIGALVDRAGADIYVTAGREEVGPRRRRTSMSQGFGAGLLRLPGGVGVLADGGGDDVYRAEDDAQGRGVSGGAGILFDAGGDDRYLGREAVQGAASARALGVLADIDGRDLYDGGAEAQGAGDGCAIGALLDAGGDDLYRAHRLAQGAASKAAVGFLYDGAGDDRYEIDEAEGQGVGAFDEDTRRGSIGLLLDEGGTDSYARPGAANGAAWSLGRWGLGFDR